MKDLKKYKTVRFWIGKASGSEVTEKVYLNRFQNFLNYYPIIDPDEIVEEWKKVNTTGGKENNS